MSEIDDLLAQELRRLPPRPSEEAAQSGKKRYSEMMSAAVARALAESLRRKGLRQTLPQSSGFGHSPEKELDIED